MKAFITGASGFIGSTLIEQLTRTGFEVHALMRRTSNPANLAGAKYLKVEGDLSDVESLKRAVAGMDYVFHLAGATAAPTRNGYFEANAHGAARLAQAVAEANPNLTRFVHVSSLAAAGPAPSLDKPRLESDSEQPVSFYGHSKLEGEKEVLKFKDRFPISIVRPPIVYGPKDKGVFVMIQTVAKNLMPIPQGCTPTGHKYYSAIHSEDLCRGIIQAAVCDKSKVASGEVFYLCGDETHTYEELMRTIAECLEKDPFRFKVPKILIRLAAAGGSAAGLFTKKTFPLNLDKVNEILPDYWICSNEKAKSMLGFKPEYRLADGMADAIAWYRRQKWL